MIEHQWKELSKYFLDNGNRKLSTEEKELPQWIQELCRTAEGDKKLMELGEKLCARLTEDGARLLLDPVCVRKM